MSLGLVPYNHSEPKLMDLVQDIYNKLIGMIKMEVERKTQTNHLEGVHNNIWASSMADL